MSSPLVIIPARGGSKGIPGKNIKPLCGRPLIAYTIDLARSVAPDSRIILSTDSAEIASVAQSICNLPVPYMRPASLGGDDISSRSVMLDVMRWADTQSIHYDCILLLQPTSPLRSAADIQRTLRAYSPDIDMAVTVTQAAANPYYDCFETSPEGFLRVAKGDGLITRRQDAPQAFQMNGAVYAINPDSLRARPLGAFERRVPVVMPRERSIDLDSPIDWLIAETIMRYGQV
ncbi:MAG: acylneuraminate cytidylyltransferase family protein [Duncaniella sp.]|nr:acylneuraminate cytidylyltransferase family protein [Duncaniella sp.]